MTKSLLSKIEEEIQFENQGEIQYGENPMPILINDGLAVPVGNGLFVLRGILVRLLDVIDRRCALIADEFRAEPIHVPNLLSQDNVKRSEYLVSFNNQALLLTRASDETRVGMACPTVCYHYFASLAHSTLKAREIITSVGKCSRFEEGQLDDLSRLTNFTMREIVGFGTADQCKADVERIQKRTIALLSEFFDLSFQLQTASDPFFGKNEDIKKKAQLLSQSKTEIRAALPFSNSVSSIVSFNRHGGVFFDRFQIKKADPSVNESFCVGFGYERILFALLAQKGVDFSSPYYKKLLAPGIRLVK